ncbi:MAG: OprD family outer membrane porin, partial [Bacteroidetes bacterium]|nr:OprD family outer membrane porin [Bacteroidota bacterium]
MGTGLALLIRYKQKPCKLFTMKQIITQICFNNNIQSLKKILFLREAFLSILFFFISSIILGQSKFDKKNASIAHRLPDSALQKPGEKGVLTADLRYLFMATDNRQGLTDYAANALGAGLKYTTGNFHGFSIGAGIYACINIRSSVLTEPDPLTGQINRYEITLFDVIHPEKKLVGGIGELFLKYRWRDSYVSIGRQLINTPFINMQDGRMRPNEAGGVYAEMRAAKKIKISLGYLWEMLPRSTNDWGSISKTIGAYPQGVTVNGTKSGYAGSLKSKGILMAGVNGSFGTKGELNLQLSEVFVENIFNT